MVRFSLVLVLLGVALVPKLLKPSGAQQQQEHSLANFRSRNKHLLQTEDKCNKTGEVSGELCLSAQRDAVDAVLSIPSSTPRDGRYTTIANNVALVIERCLSGSNVPLIKPLRIITFNETAFLLSTIGTAFYASTKYQSQYVVKAWTPGANDQLLAEILFAIKSNFTTYDGFVFDTMAITDLALAGGHTDLRSFIANDPTVEWEDIFHFTREVATTYDGKVVGMPVFMGTPFLYYRRDIFQALNLSVPNTWAEMLDLGRTLNGTDWNGDNVTDYSICFATEGWDTYFIFSSILVSMTQTKGYRRSGLFDPLTLEPLAQGAAMLRALELYRGLSQYARSYPNDAFTTPFQKGECVMALRSADVFKSAHSAGSRAPGQRGPPIHKGKLGVALVPGSEVYLDRTTGKLLPCVLDGACTDVVAGPNGTLVSINRTPMIGPVGFSGAVNPRATPVYQKVVYSFWALVASPAISGTFIVFQPLSPAAPFRYSHMALDRWVKAGYDVEDSRQFLAALATTVAHPNIALDLRMPFAGTYRDVLTDAAGLAYGRLDIPVTNIEQSTVARMQQLLARNGPMDAQRAAYWRAIDFKPPSQPPAPPLPEPALVADSSHRHSAGLAAAIVVPLVVSALLLGAAVFLLRLQRRRNRSLMGAVMAPGPGPLTTLVITDVEGATALTEAFHDALDMALHVHNNILLECLARHSGYCSATEGDSMICAFHHPLDATKFAVEAQEALLHASYPAELIAQGTACEPVWAWAPQSLEWLYGTQLRGGAGGMLRGGRRSVPGTSGLSSLAALLAPRVRSRTSPSTSIATGGSGRLKGSGRSLLQSWSLARTVKGDTASGRGALKSLPSVSGLLTVSDRALSLVGSGLHPGISGISNPGGMQPGGVTWGGAVVPIPSSAPSPRITHQASAVMGSSQLSPVTSIAEHGAGASPSWQPIPQSSHEGGGPGMSQRLSSNWGAIGKFQQSQRARWSGAGLIQSISPTAAAYTTAVDSGQTGSGPPLGQPGQHRLPVASRVHDRLLRAAAEPLGGPSSSSGEGAMVRGAPSGPGPGHAAAHAQSTRLTGHGLLDAWDTSLMHNHQDGMSNMCTVSMTELQQGMMRPPASGHTSGQHSTLPGARSSMPLVSAQSPLGMYGQSGNMMQPSTLMASPLFPRDVHMGAGPSFALTSMVTEAMSANLSSQPPAYGGLLNTGGRTSDFAGHEATGTSLAGLPMTAVSVVGPLPRTHLNSQTGVAGMLGAGWGAMHPRLQSTTILPSSRFLEDVPHPTGATTLRAALAETVLTTSGESAPSTQHDKAARWALVFRGLRIRCGIHSGFEANEVMYNASMGRMQYRGEAMAIARAVCDAAVGGMVLLSERAFSAISVDQLCSAAFVAHAGEHWLLGLGASAVLRAGTGSGSAKAAGDAVAAGGQRSSMQQAGGVKEVVGLDGRGSNHSSSMGGSFTERHSRGSRGMAHEASKLRGGDEGGQAVPALPTSPSSGLGPLLAGGLRKLRESVAGDRRRSRVEARGGDAHVQPHQSYMEGEEEGGGNGREGRAARTSPPGHNRGRSVSEPGAPGTAAGGAAKSGGHNAAGSTSGSARGVVLYHACSPQLALRLPLLRPIRSIGHVSRGYLDAPHACVTIVFIKPQGVAELMAWNAEVAQASLALFNKVALRELARAGVAMQHISEDGDNPGAGGDSEAGDHEGSGFCNGDGYLCDVSDALGVLLAFSRPGAALRCALATIRACLSAPWDPVLLEHPLGEEVASAFQGPSSLPLLANRELSVRSTARGPEANRGMPSGGAAFGTQRTSMVAPTTHRHTSFTRATLGALGREGDALASGAPGSGATAARCAQSLQSQAGGRLSARRCSSPGTVATPSAEQLQELELEVHTSVGGEATLGVGGAGGVQIGGGRSEPGAAPARPPLHSPSASSRRTGGAGLSGLGSSPAGSNAYTASSHPTPAAPGHALSRTASQRRHSLHSTQHLHGSAGQRVQPAGGRNSHSSSLMDSSPRVALAAAFASNHNAASSPNQSQQHGYVLLDDDTPRSHGHIHDGRARPGSGGGPRQRSLLVTSLTSIHSAHAPYSSATLPLLSNEFSAGRASAHLSHQAHSSQRSMLHDLHHMSGEHGDIARGPGAPPLTQPRCRARSFEYMCDSTATQQAASAEHGSGGMTGGQVPAGRDLPSAAGRAVLLRGLRLKVGMDTGPVRTSLHPVSCRVQYHGKPLNRAARIMTAAKSGQVWCSRTVWDAASAMDLLGDAWQPEGVWGLEDELMPEGARLMQSTLPPVSGPPITGTQLGPHKLKGVPEPIELLHVQFESEVLIAVDTGGPGSGGGDGVGPASLTPSPLLVDRLPSSRSLRNHSSHQLSFGYRTNISVSLQAQTSSRSRGSHAVCLHTSVAADAGGEAVQLPLASAACDARCSGDHTDSRPPGRVPSASAGGAGRGSNEQVAVLVVEPAPLPAFAPPLSPVPVLAAPPASGITPPANGSTPAPAVLSLLAARQLHGEVDPAGVVLGGGATHTASFSASGTVSGRKVVQWEESMCVAEEIEVEVGGRAAGGAQQTPTLGRTTPNIGKGMGYGRDGVQAHT